MTSTHHLAELNIGRLLAPADNTPFAQGIEHRRAHRSTAIGTLAVGVMVLMLSGCLGSMAPPPVSKSPEAVGDYEVSDAVYHAEFFKGAPYIEQERDSAGRLKLVNGLPVPINFVFMDAAGVNPKIVVSRKDGSPLGVDDEATALKVAAMLCADKGRRPYYQPGVYQAPFPATPALENGKWGVFNLCR
ncbi:MAG: hypothetical protein ACKVPY_16515 [Paracoccaceae bacterium]